MSPLLVPHTLLSLRGPRYLRLHRMTMPRMKGRWKMRCLNRASRLLLEPWTQRSPYLLFLPPLPKRLGRLHLLLLILMTDPHRSSLLNLLPMSLALPRVTSAHRHRRHPLCRPNSQTDGFLDRHHQTGKSPRVISRCSIPDGLLRRRQ